MSPFISHRHVSQRGQVLAVLSITTVLALTGCSDSASSTSEPAAPSTTAATTVDTSAGSDSAADLTAYCERIAALGGEVPEAYVGSAEHQADTQSLLEVAPQAVVAPLQTFAAFLASGAIDPGDPESNLAESWPPEVQEAIAEIEAFSDASC